MSASFWNQDENFIDTEEIKKTYVSNSPSHHPISFGEGEYIDYVIVLDAHMFSTIIHEVPAQKFVTHQWALSVKYRFCWTFHIRNETTARPDKTQPHNEGAEAVGKAVLIVKVNGPIGKWIFKKRVIYRLNEHFLF